MDVEVDELLKRIDGRGFWLRYLNEASCPSSPVGIHLAIFSEPFLSRVLSGEKTVDSRFSRNRCAPFGEIAEGDIILVKEVAGPICGLALAKRIWFFDLGSETLDQIRHEHGTAICADEAFWDGRADASFATLIELAETTTINPLNVEKRDRRGWVPLRSRQFSFAF